MKTLLKNSTIVLVLLGFFASSCEKEKAVQPAPAAPVMEAKTTWTPKGSSTPTVTKGDVEEGERGVTYAIEPKLAACNCNGTWSFVIVPEKNNQYSATINKNNGTVSFMTMLSGNYKITISYKCPDGSTISVTVTITVK